MTVHLTLEEVLERLEGNNCGLSSEEDSDIKRDRINGYIAEANITLRLAAMCSEEGAGCRGRRRLR